jgi:hypothetical protein
MSRKKIDLHLNIREILGRIETVKDEIYPEKKTGNKKWANLVSVSESLISQLHPRKPRNEIKEPSLEYIIAVARATKKPIEYYLYGDSTQMPTSVAIEKPPDNTNSEDSTEKVIAQKILAVLTDIKNANLNGVVNDKLDLMDQKLDICGIELKNVILILERFVNTQNAKKEEFASKKEAS